MELSLALQHNLYAHVSFVLATAAVLQTSAVLCHIATVDAICSAVLEHSLLYFFNAKPVMFKLG